MFSNAYYLHPSRINFQIHLTTFPQPILVLLQKTPVRKGKQKHECNMLMTGYANKAFYPFVDICQRSLNHTNISGPHNKTP